MQINFIKEVLQEFNDHHINYCILRNYEFLLGSSDPIESMDTVISKEDMLRANQILVTKGFIQRKQQFSLKHKAYFKILNSKVISFDIQVGGVHWNDMRYLDVLTNKVKKDFFYVPSDNDTFVMLLTHSILGKRYFKPKYQQILHSLDINQDYVLNHLSRIFNKTIAQELYHKVRNNQFHKINSYQLAAYFILKKPLRIATMTALTLRWIKWKKFLQPSPLISFVGPDGAGKSTFSSAVNNYLKDNGRNVSNVYMGRGRSHILPITTLGRKYKSREKKKDLAKITKPKRNLLYTLTAPVFTFDLFLRYYFTILPQRMKKNIVITDRYCSDITLMKHVPLKFKKLLLKLFPRPTISIYLHNDAETLHQRRPEEPINELQRQMEIFDKFDYSLRLQTTNKQKDIQKVTDFVFSKLLQDWY